MERIAESSGCILGGGSTACAGLHPSAQDSEASPSEEATDVVPHQAPRVSWMPRLYSACGSSTEKRMRKMGTVPDLALRTARTTQRAEKATLTWRGPGDSPGAAD